MLEEGMMWQANDLLRLSSWNVSRMSIKEHNPSKGGGFEMKFSTTIIKSFAKGIS